MTRHHLRKDKTCLNCGATVPDRYCSHCGQENTAPKESFGHLIGHFVADVTHYDSQFFTTIKDLIIKPGFLTREYYAGKRLSYLNPIRMYIFISAVFFLVMFSQKQEENNTNTNTTPKQDINLFRQHLADSLRSTIKHTGKLSMNDNIRNGIYAQLATHLDTLPGKKIAGESVGASFSNSGIVIFRLQQDEYKTIREYDSVQNKLPDTAKNNKILAYIIRKAIRLKQKGSNNGEVVVTQNIGHDIPKIMFVLLPLFAVFVGFFYSRKKWWFTQHAIFSLHFHSFVFIFLMLISLVSMLLPMDSLGMIKIVAMITLLGIFIYLLAALHTAYREALWRSFIKAVFISLLYVTAVLICLCAITGITFVLI